MSIQVVGVSKLYGQQKALDGVSLSVPSGQIMGFLGPNGAGKSTLMRIITGYLQPSAGHVEIMGQPIAGARDDFRRFIGYLPENNPLYPEMYVKEYLAFVARVYRLGRMASRRVKEMVELTGITHEQHKRIGELSKGYRQRVGLAQALLNRPSVLILDEPTSGLDPNQIIEIRKLILEVGQEKTVMLSTHIMQEVEALCRRVAIINRGRIVADDSTEQVLAMASGTQQSVLVEFAQPVAPDLLRAIAGVEGVQPMGPCALLVQSNSPEDLRPAIFRFAAQGGHTILTMQLKARQMEEVFQALTLT